jgi:hypothetical protein
LTQKHKIAFIAQRIRARDHVSVATLQHCVHAPKEFFPFYKETMSIGLAPQTSFLCPFSKPNPFGRDACSNVGTCGLDPCKPVLAGLQTILQHAVVDLKNAQEMHLADV